MASGPRLRSPTLLAMAVKVEDGVLREGDTQLAAVDGPLDWGFLRIVLAKLTFATSIEPAGIWSSLQHCAL